MSALEVVGVVVSATALLLSGAQRVAKPYQRLREKKDRASKVRNDHGLIIACLLTLLPDGHSSMDRIQRVLAGTKVELDEFRQSLNSNMNMVAIAGAIIAQIAITGLSLEAMSQAHWTAAAFLVVSLIFGLISVYVAFIVQQELNGLLGSGGFADWLTLTPSAQELPSNRYSSSRHPAVPQTQESSQPRTEAVPRAEHSPVDLHLQREPSALAAIMMATPSGLLGLSLNAFIFGLGIYLGSAYTGNLVPDFGKGGSLGILIFYIVAATTGTFLYMFPRLLKSSETQG